MKAETLAALAARKTRASGESPYSEKAFLVPTEVIHPPPPPYAEVHLHPAASLVGSQPASPTLGPRPASNDVSMA